MNKNITVVIPNFNGEKYIENCIESLLKQTFFDFEIIIVDDCSKDSSVELIRNFENIQLICNSQNSGFAISVNNGIKAASGRYILLLNNDVVVETDFVEQLYKAIEKDLKVFSVSSKMIRYYERDKIDDTGDFYNLLGWAYKRGDGKSIDALNKPTAVFSTCAGAGIYRKEVFDKIGVFDAHYFAYMEDVDVSYRAQVFGYKNYFEPKAICYHIGSATTADGNKYSSFKVEISARNNIYTIYKNMPLIQIIINLPFLLCGFLIKGLLFWTKGFGKEYGKGLITGISTLSNVKKVRFKKKHFLNYLKIEAMLIGNVFRYIYEKMSK